MDIELIHNYIEGNLSGEALTKFETALKQDQSLRDELDLQKAMLSHLSTGSDINAAKSVITEVHQSFESKETTIKKMRPWAWAGIAIAAGLALLLILRTPGSPSNPEQLFVTYYNQPVASFTVKGNAQDEILQKAELAYNNENYQESLVLFSQYIDENPDPDGTVLFYQAQAMISVDELDDAIKTLAVLKVEHPVFANDCDWYLALIQLKKGALSQSVAILNTLLDSGYAVKAAALLKSIEQIKD